MTRDLNPPQSLKELLPLKWVQDQMKRNRNAISVKGGLQLVSENYKTVVHLLEFSSLGQFSPYVTTYTVE
ncbi:CLUMA_CG012907, isoform A [Clunio marinus]|uniref:CLUMA_CG012907, isoform A n=1 Tax=Clunio marinus TaxID=568069 RepID=A0A1J1IH98_9DIPT|nr:CLUMA_CG012907, isoform A [Clunio marinus]